MGWTQKSYDAIFGWLEVAKRANIRKILLADGLSDVIARLDTAKTMGDWYRITQEAREAVTPDIINKSARTAEIELNRLAKHCNVH